jgi:hypothetical protein
MGNEEENIKISFNIKNSSEKFHSNYGDKFRLNVAFEYDSELTQINLKERKIIVGKGFRGNPQVDGKVISGDTTEILYYDQKKGLYSVSTDKTETDYENVSPIKFYGFSTTTNQMDFGALSDAAIIQLNTEGKETPMIHYPKIVESSFKKLSYIGPLREFPKAFYTTTGKSPRYYIGKKGENAIDILWALKKARNDTGIQNLETKIKRWIAEFGFADDITLEPIGDNVGYRALATDPQSKFDVNIINVGFGVSQTLPIIIQSFYSDEDSTNLIEQPEIHLHPKAQSILGDMFIDAINEKNKNFIIETHSEHLLARVRRRIAEGKISRDDIKIYYFDPTPEGTEIQEVTLNEYGQYEKFPEGFFEEDLNEAFAHMKVISESKAKGANGE